MRDIVRVLRVIEYVGDRQWVEGQVDKSIHGTKIPNPRFPHNQIRVATIGTYPEILGQVEDQVVGEVEGKSNE